MVFSELLRWTKGHNSLLAQLKECCKNHVEEVVAEVAVREKKAYAEEGVDE